MKILAEEEYENKIFYQVLGDWKPSWIHMLSINVLYVNRS